MITLYEIGPGGYWTGLTREQPDDQVVPSGWTARPVPEEQPAGQHAVLTLAGWQFTSVAPPEAAVHPELEPVATVRHLSVGSFFDRFGAFKYPILASTDAGVQALIKDCSVRSYIDLGNPDLPMGLALIQAAGFAIDAESVLTAPVRDEERP